MILFPTRSVST